MIKHWGEVGHQVRLFEEKNIMVSPESSQLLGKQKQKQKIHHQLCLVTGHGSTHLLNLALDISICGRAFINLRLKSQSVPDLHPWLHFGLCSCAVCLLPLTWQNPSFLFQRHMASNSLIIFQSCSFRTFTISWTLTFCNFLKIQGIELNESFKPYLKYQEKLRQGYFVFRI